MLHAIISLFLWGETALNINRLLKLSAKFSFCFTGLLAFVSTSHASTFDISLIYDGASLELAPGSSSLAGIALEQDDVLNWTIKTASGATLTATKDFSMFFVAHVSDAAERTGDYSVSIKLDNSTFDTQSNSNQFAQFVHIGGSVLLTDNQIFDELAYSWTQLTIAESSDPDQPGPMNPNTVLTGAFIPKFQDFIDDGSLIYQTAVPIPATAWLFASGIIGHIATRKRKHSLSIHC